jgi:hypothetical protein
MNTAIANLIILTAELAGDNIAGTAIDGDIKVLFTVGASEVNQRLFVSEANLVVFGKFRLGCDAYSVSIGIKSVVTVVSLPSTVPSEVADPVEVAAPIAETKKRKSTSTRSKKTAKPDLVAA